MHDRAGLLRAACVFTAVFGALLIVVPAIGRQGFSLLMFGDAGVIDSWPAEPRRYITLLHGVLGAVMVGWGVALWWVLRPGVAPGWGWRVVAVSALCWFVPDTLFSAALQAWPNVALNIGFAALFGAGLWRARASRTAQRAG